MIDRYGFCNKSELAVKAAEKMGFLPNRFVWATEYNGKIFVMGGCGKQRDFDRLVSTCVDHGYTYVNRWERLEDYDSQH